VCVCVCVCVCDLGFELRVSWLIDRCSTAWATPPALFASVNLEIGFIFCTGQPGHQFFYFTFPPMLGWQAHDISFYLLRGGFHKHVLHRPSWNHSLPNVSLPSILRRQAFITPSYWLRWVSQTLCLGWSLTWIYPVSASQLTMIAGINHRHLTVIYLYKLLMWFIIRLKNLYVFVCEICFL
jgi:hypothetical protein